MGWTIILENESGQAIHQLSKEFNYDELDNFSSNNFKILRYIDPYGDTTFNGLQLNDLQKDFEKLQKLIPDQGGIIEQIIELINESKNEVHTYIKFYGD